MEPGTVVQLTVWRDGKEQTFSATLDTYPADTDQPNQPTPPDQNDQAPLQSSTGLTLVPNGNGEGVLVQDVNPDSVAADKGFAVGDAILEVNNQKVSTPKQFEDAIKAVRDSGKTSALIKASRGDRVLFLGLPLDQAKN
jgi:serine protease Do